MDGSLINSIQKQAFYKQIYEQFTAIDFSQHHHFWFEFFDFKQYFQNKLS